MKDEHAEPRRETRGAMAVMGTQVRTSNEPEGDPVRQIGSHWQRFYGEGLAGRIPNRTDTNVVYGVYTHYESDYRGPYSHLIACEVGDSANVPEGMSALTIPAAEYLVFTGVGEMPAVVMETWRAVWQHFEQSSRDERAYTVDFERYDQREPSRVEVHVAVK